MTHRVCIVGAAGRMGERLIRLLPEYEALRLGAALDKKAVPHAPEGTVVTNDPSEALAVAEVVVDFAAPPAIGRVVPACVAKKIPYIVGSTGLGDKEHAALDEAAKKIPVLEATNMSVGVNVLLELVELAAARLGERFEPEIFEVHHRHKRDAPSGTALSLGEAVKRGRGDLADVIGRAGQGPERAPSELGYGALRGGDVTGEHTVFFFGDGERLELTHRATNRDIFARGALRAAAWIVGQAPGRYQMRDVGQ